MIGSPGQRQGSLARHLCRLAMLCALIGACAPASAETYPSRPIRIITPNSPGGIEVNLRAILPRLQAILGQPLVLESRPGASGALGSELVARAEPDGYTLLFSTSAPIVTTPLLKSNLRYDPIKDFTPITRMLQPMEALVVNTNLPVRSVADLVRHAKAHPGALTYASSGAGSLPHFNGEQFKVAAGVDMLHVPFNGLGQIVPELIAGRINVAFFSLNVAFPLADAGQTRILASLDAGEDTSKAGLPSIRETLPNFRRAPFWYGLLGPAGLSDEIAIKLRDAVRRAIDETESARILFEKNFVRVLVDDQSRFRQSIQDDRAATLELIARIGMRAE